MSEEIHAICQYCQYPKEAGHAPTCPTNNNASENSGNSNLEKEKSIENPTHAEVIEQIEKIINGKYEVERERENAEGLYLIEAVVTDEKGGKAEYAYMRKGKYKEGSTAVTGIQVTHYDSDGMPFNGTTVAEFIDGKWVEYT